MDDTKSLLMPRAQWSLALVLESLFGAFLKSIQGLEGSRIYHAPVPEDRNRYVRWKVTCTKEFKVERLPLFELINGK